MVEEDDAGHICGKLGGESPSPRWICLSLHRLHAVGGEKTEGMLQAMGRERSRHRLHAWGGEKNEQRL